MDSIAFYQRNYTSNTDFTYRSVASERASMKVSHNWGDTSNSSITVYYRNNAIGQNPNYSIRWIAPATTASGEINENSLKV